METRASPAKDIIGRSEQFHSPCRIARRANMTRPRSSSVRAERYRKAEAQLAQSLRHCRNEPSILDLQMRSLQRAMRLLVQFAEESGHRAQELTSVTTNRTTAADLEPELYRSMLSQRWRAERQYHLISQHMKILEQTITSLTSILSGARNTLSQGGHDGDQVPGPEDKTGTNLVSFLCCPQRVAPLHHRSRSRFLKLYLRPLYLNPSAATPAAITTSPQTTPTFTPGTDSSSDSSLDMHIQTPVVTDSLAEQQARLRLLINRDEEAGTAIILTQPLPSPIPLDPSNIEVELPDYVHELLADFDGQGKPLPVAPTTVKFESDENAINAAPKSRLWPFRTRRKGQSPTKSPSQPSLRTKASLKRISEFLLTPDLLAIRRKVNTTEDESRATLISVSETGSRDIDCATPSQSSSSDKVIGKMASNIGRRISFANTKLEHN